MDDFFDKPSGDELENRLAAFETPARRFGSVKADLDVRPLPSGFQSFDKFMLLRAKRPDLFVIGARPGNGKTSFLVQMLRNVARAGEGFTMMFSAEMAHDQLVLRQLAAEIGCSPQRLKQVQAHRLTKAEETLNADDFYVDDRSGIDINTLRARVMDFNRRCGLAAVGVDYMQIVRGCERVGDRRQEVGEVAQGLKQLAKDINVPVIALAQMSREIEKRQAVSKSARPVMSDLQECSLVENWADQILFLDGAGKRDPLRVGQIDAYIAKNRHGPVGDFVLAFDGETTRFSDFEEGL